METWIQSTDNFTLKAIEATSSGLSEYCYPSSGLLTNSKSFDWNYISIYFSIFIKNFYKFQKSIKMLE